MTNYRCNESIRLRLKSRTYKIVDKTANTRTIIVAITQHYEITWQLSTLKCILFTSKKKKKSNLLSIFIYIEQDWKAKTVINYKNSKDLTEYKFFKSAAAHSDRNIRYVLLDDHEEYY